MEKVSNSVQSRILVFEDLCRGPSAVHSFASCELAPRLLLDPLAVTARVSGLWYTEVQFLESLPCDHDITEEAARQFCLLLCLTRSEDDSGEALGKMSCTAEIQAAFILSSLVTFFSGLFILLISRLIWRSIKKWQKSEGKGIFSVSSPVWRSETGLACVCV